MPVRLSGDDQAAPAAAGVLFAVEPPGSGSLLEGQVGHEVGDVDEVGVIFVGSLFS
ncbi:hypothetical protein [Streptomyces sp. NPDC047841]|uniref:hypothetical protein n=1 Tax=Streptomyces sp. NPDC047841 TaxID=3154708 RepID=UPI00345553AE